MVYPEGVGRGTIKPFNQSSKKINKLFSVFHSNRGFGLIEVMIAAALLLIISVGMTTLMTNMQKEQRRQNLLQVLVSNKNRFENAMKNDSSWSQTFSDATNNANMACLRNKVTCDGTHVSATTNMVDATISDTFVNSAGRDIVVRDGGNPSNIFYDGRQSSNTAGFTDTGAACTGFSYNMATGNDSCPIGYIVNWRALSATTNPQIVVVAKLVYNPSATSPFKTFINADASSALGKYDVNLLRTATATSKSFSVNVVHTLTGTGTCGGDGYGACTSAYGAYGGGDLVDATGVYTEASDQFDLVTIPAGVAYFTINKVGSYKCTIRTYAFGVNGAEMQLINSTTNAVLAGPAQGFASLATSAYSTLVLDSVIDITAINTNVTIVQKCQTPPPIGPTWGCALGFATPPYGATSNSASMNCVLLE
jgi:prepilin-type N-terminal cleavage/methylation domain-containing protein